MTKGRKSQSHITRLRLLSLATLAILGAFGYWLNAERSSREVPRVAPEQLASSSERKLSSQAVIPSSDLGRFVFAGEPKSTDGAKLVRLENIGYIVEYDELKKNPRWVAYKLTGEAVFSPSPRPSRFQTDQRTASMVSHKDYTGSAYDRGHMAPNYAIASRFGNTAQAETFLMSNVVPQLPTLNRGVWRMLEDVLSKTTAPNCEEIWIVVGPVYAPGPHQEARLAGGPVIPDGFFAVIADVLSDVSEVRLQAFFVPKDAARGADLRDFITSVDDIENVTGLDFYGELDDEMEEQIESMQAAYWLED